VLYDNGTTTIGRSPVEQLGDGSSQVAVPGPGREVFGEQRYKGEPGHRVARAVEHRRGQEPVVQVYGEHPKFRVSQELFEPGE
jgi:hypothetical protein